MALSLSQTAALADILEPGMRVASMGYPDLIALTPAILKEFGEMDGLEFRKDSDTICRRHGLAPIKVIPDAHSFFSLLGCELDVFDIVQERGGEILCDLNEVGMGISYTRGGIYACYDIVLDVGTVEHCFNIGQALMNMAGMVKKGGYILHENPYNCGNHGFYNLNPTWYADFYAANGFKLLDCRLVSRDGRGAVVPLTKRFKPPSEEVNVFALAQRTEIKPMVYPMQSKYVKAPAAGDRAKEVAHG